MTAPTHERVAVADSVDAPEDFARRLRWYFNRVRVMPPRELPHRARELAMRRTGRRLTVAERGVQLTAETTGLGELIRDWQHRTGVSEWWRCQADAVASGEVRVFGCECVVGANGTPYWRRDPVTGSVWPDDYCFAIDYRHRAAYGDVKFVWELNRLGYLLPVAAHAAATRNPEAAALCARHVQSWIGENRPYRGVVWASGIELSVRLVNLVAIAELLRSQVGIDLSDIVRSHVVWLRRFPSRYSSANNHRIAELVGLLVVNAAYPSLVPPDEAQRIWRELDKQAQIQISSDGVSLEQSTTYGLAVLEWLLIATILGRRLNLAWTEETHSRISSLGDWLSTLTDCNGNLVRVGDDDEGRSLGAALPPSDFAQATVELAKAVGFPAQAPSSGLRSFPRGGCSVGRDSVAGTQVLWLIDHGPLGFGDIAAHAHADTLAVYLHVGGKPVIVDAGTYLFHTSGGWRDWLRSTPAHNTLTVDARDSSRMVSAFNWHARARASARLRRVEKRKEGWLVDVDHDGYVRALGVTHRRTLESSGGGRYRMVDELDSSRLMRCTWSLLLHPDLSAVDTGSGWQVSCARRPVLRITTPTGFLRRVLAGSVDPVGGWHSARYGELERSQQLLLDGELGDGRRLGVDVEVLA